MNTFFRWDSEICAAIKVLKLWDEVSFGCHVKRDKIIWSRLIDTFVTFQNALLIALCLYKTIEYLFADSELVCFRLSRKHSVLMILLSLRLRLGLSYQLPVHLLKIAVWSLELTFIGAFIRKRF